MRRLMLAVALVAAPVGVLMVPLAGPAAGDFICNDGAISHAVHSQGACSHHGGISSGAPAVATPSPTPTPSSAGDLDCADFTYQEDAQANLVANPSDPNGLDADHDGIACEDNPHRPATVLPVVQPVVQSPRVGLVQPAPELAGSSSVTLSGTALPRTGVRTLDLAAAAVVILGVGLLALRATWGTQLDR